MVHENKKHSLAINYNDSLFKLFWEKYLKISAIICSLKHTSKTHNDLFLTQARSNISKKWSYLK